MRILVVGSGGREHALAWKLSQEAEVIVAPGNPGIAEDCEIVPVSVSDFPGLISLAKDRNIDLVVVGPEDPLIEGLADEMRNAGLAVFGPNQTGAQLEGSKAFSKDMMQKAGVPTAAFQSFTDPIAAKAFAEATFAAGSQVAVKASGNALGKGVIVADTYGQAAEAIDQMMVEKVFGDAGETVVVEQRLHGPEFSVISLVGDLNFVTLPVSQDHKRAFDGDQGPNTGGMGTYSPVVWLDQEVVAQVEQRTVAPMVSRLRKDGIPYRGILFSGLMLHQGIPHCLEYNVRFGDPEAQSILSRLGKGFAEALWQAAHGEIIAPPEVLKNSVATVVVASGGYPGRYPKGVPISIGSLPPGVKLFHAGTALKDGQLVTAGGRVIAVTATADSLHEARTLAYRGVEAVQFEGKQFRTDIAAMSGGSVA